MGKSPLTLKAVVYFGVLLSRGAIAQHPGYTTDTLKAFAFPGGTERPFFVLIAPYRLAGRSTLRNSSSFTIKLVRYDSPVYALSGSLYLSAIGEGNGRH